LKRELDELDKKIILSLSRGVHSYAEIAERCGVGKNTVYRRISRLESEKIIDRRFRALPNFTKLNLSAICVMMDVAQSDVEKVLRILKRQSQVKFIWRTFGASNITTVIICNKGEEGKCISNLRGLMEKMRVKLNKFEAAISFTWEKIDFSPF
jgi:DNA-binding Lrp family transcriptional regulator